jgi:hypothetical protein
MAHDTVSACTAFAGSELIAAGSLREVAVAVRRVLDEAPDSTVLVFDDADARPVELDLRGTVDDVASRYEESEPSTAEEGAADSLGDGAGQRSPGRPKLGVVGKEVTLLPRHWEWLAAQPGGASVTLRKLVETARKQGAEAERVRASRDTAYRFASALAGNEPGYEEAMRALFAGDEPHFEAFTASWPPAVRDYARRLAASSFPSGDA